MLVISFGSGLNSQIHFVTCNQKQRESETESLEKEVRSEKEKDKESGREIKR